MSTPPPPGPPSGGAQPWSEQTPPPGQPAGWSPGPPASAGSWGSPPASTGSWGSPPPSLPLPPPRLPTEEREYHHFWRTPSHRWWKPLLVLVIHAVVLFLLSTALGVAILVDDVALGGSLFGMDATNLSELALTPGLLVANNLLLAALIPVGMLSQWLVYGQRPRWLSSVEGGLRWRWIWVCAAVVVPIWLLVLAVETLLTGGLSVQGTQIALFLTLIVLTVPFQAAGEEYGLRGTLTRAVAAWIPGRQVALVVSTLVSATVFMLLHGAGDLWLNVFYFGFAVVASLLVWRTGGLEAAVVIHVVNNLVAFTVTVLAGELDSVFERDAGVASPAVLIQVGVLVVTAVILDRLAARRRLRRATAPDAHRWDEVQRPWGPPAPQQSGSLGEERPAAALPPTGYGPPPDYAPPASYGPPSASSGPPSGDAPSSGFGPPPPGARRDVPPSG